MPSQRANITKSAGLYTFLSELSAPEGAQVIADNVNIDKLGVITPRRGFNDYGDALTQSTDRVRQIMQYKGRILRHFNTTLEFDDGSETFTAFAGNYSEVEPGFRIKFLESNGNFYFTTSDGIKKISATAASQLTPSSGYITDAGAPKAVGLSGKIQPSTGGFLPPQSKVAYKILFGYKDKNNNLILGTPSARQVISNTSEDRFTSENTTVEFINGETGGGEYIGNYWILYTKDSGYYVWYNDAADSADQPQTNETIGKTGIEVIIQNPGTNDEILNATGNAIDSVIGDKFEITINTANDLLTLISTEDGSIPDASQGTMSISDMSVTVSQQGAVSEGSNANVQLSFIIPNGVTTDYFYQIYRTANVTVSEGITLNDIDPGEDANLVIENPVTVSPGAEITVVDSTPNTFRNTGTPLYNNPISGQGLLQTNDRPPIAKDIESFSNFTFYANTKTFHRFTFNIVSVDDFGNLETDFIIGNEDGRYKYTFQGQQEQTTIDCGTVADTAETTSSNDSYISLYSAGDKRQYYIWFDKGAGDDPLIENATGIRVNLTGAGSAENVAPYLADAVELIDDFSVSETATSVTIENVNNGDTTDTDTPTSTPSTDIGTGWAITIDNQGTGEDAANNYALWSILPSVGQSIEETARSLVSVINQDVNSPVNAFYLSGANDLPGQILLENRNLEDKPFYVAVRNTGTIGDDIGGEFSPNLPVINDTVSLSSVGDETVVTSASHGLLEGDLVYVYAPNNSPAITAAYTISSVTTNTFAIPVETIVIDSTDAFFFLASQESDNLEAPNRIYYSKLGQPEAVPISNFIDVGGKDGSIERILALRDNLFILKEDGTYILSGTPPFSIRLLDNTSNIVAPDSAVVMNNQIFSLNEDGIVTITETGVSLISRPIEDLISNVTREEFDFRLKTFGVSYESDKAYLIWLPSRTTDAVATQSYRYNVFERTWTRWTVPATSGFVSRRDKLYIGDGTRNYLQRERKNNDRTDFSDRNFTLSVPNNAILGKEIQLSSVSDVNIGDVLVQTQYLTITLYNNFLNKLELDPDVSKVLVSLDTSTDTFTASSHGFANEDQVNVNGTIYYIINANSNTFQVSEVKNGAAFDFDVDFNVVVVNRVFDQLALSAGANVASAMDVINNKLISIGVNVTSHVYLNSDWESLSNSFNDLIDEINSTISGTRFKNYRKIETTTEYESIITEIDTLKNTVTVLFDPLFIEGTIENHLGIATEIQWSPLHFGDPSSLKQVSKGTIIFDQNNFTKATTSYSSDLSQDFIPINITGKGVGYWGSATWGNPDLYWGGNGNDVPNMNIIPREKQRCRYINVKFEHNIAREDFRILGVTAVVRIVSDRAYR